MKTGFEIVGTVTISKKNRAGFEEKVTLKNMVVNWGLVNLAGVIAGTAFPSTIGNTYCLQLKDLHGLWLLSCHFKRD